MTAPADASPDPSRTGVFWVEDPGHSLAGVRLWQHVGMSGDQVHFYRISGGWQLAVRLPDLMRLEYLLELRHQDGRLELVTDPDNADYASGAFGDKSVLEVPGYQRPAWLDAHPPRGETITIDLANRGLPGHLCAQLWSAVGTSAEDPLPLLVAHDGPELARFADLPLFLDEMVAAGRLPKMRAALLTPGHRNVNYAASPEYAKALCLGLIPRIEHQVPTARHGQGHGLAIRAGLGVSLGGLAMLHAQRRYPQVFSGLYLQSGSFFTPSLDAQESGHPVFGPVTRYVASVLRAGAEWEHAVPTTMTVGTVEENRANNEQMAVALTAQAYPVRLFRQRDGHNWICWRDTWDPHLVDLINTAFDTPDGASPPG